MKRRTAIIISSAVIALIAAACIVAAAVGNEKIDVRVIDEENGEYMLINVPSDYSFDIGTEGKQGKLKKKDFYVYDIYGNKIDAKKSLTGKRMTIKSPDGGYEKGSVYTLDLKGKAKFLDESYRKAEKITFVIEQKETARIDYQDGVIELGGESVELNNGRLTIEGRYKTGDIIIVDTNDDYIDEIYKLKNAKYKNNKTTAVFEEPAAEEVYKDIDIFYYDDVDMRKADIDEEAFLGAIEETGVLDAFTEEAYAADSSNITITSKQGKGNSYEFTALLKDPADERRQLKISFGISDRSLIKYDKKIAIVDNDLQITSGLEFSVKGKGSKKTESSIREALEDYKGVASENSEAGDYDVPLVPIKIPVVGPINVYIELGLTANVAFSAEFNAGVDTSLTFSQGIVFDTGEKQVKKTYADITGDIDAHIMVSGELDAFAGAYVKGGLDIPLLLDLGIDAKGGPYLEGEGCFIVKGIPKDIKSDGYYRLEIGIMFSSNAKIKVLMFDEKSIPIADKKRPLYQLSKYLKLKETDLKDTYYLTDDRIEIGKINATYHSIIEDKDITEEVIEYSLYVDDEKVQIENGVIISPVSNGTHKFKLKWKYEGDKYEIEPANKKSRLN